MKSCHVKCGCLVWWNLARVATGPFLDELQLYSFHSFLRYFRVEAPKIAQHLPLPSQNWSLHQDEHCAAWSTSEGPMLLGVSRCPRHRAGDVIDPSDFFDFSVLVELAFSDCHLMKLSLGQGDQAELEETLLAVFRSFPALFH